MIYTITLNPSIDYTVSVKDLQIGKLNRAESESIRAGGKGLNVSAVLANLGMKSVALGFTAGVIGEAIEKLTLSQGLTTDFIGVEGESRINVKVLGVDGVTEINGGARFDERRIAELKRKLSGLTADDYLVLSGNAPSESVYADLLESVAEFGAKTVVDASGKLLTSCLPYKPFLIKPNLLELLELFDRTEAREDEIFEMAEKLRALGTRNVIVSLGGDGAIMITESGKRLRAPAPKGNPVNTVGAGDSLVAGFIYGYEKSKDYAEALRYGVNVGSATAFSGELATKEEIAKLGEIL